MKCDHFLEFTGQNWSSSSANRITYYFWAGALFHINSGFNSPIIKLHNNFLIDALDLLWLRLVSPWHVSFLCEISNGHWKDYQRVQSAWTNAYHNLADYWLFHQPQTIRVFIMCIYECYVHIWVDTVIISRLM